MVATKMVAILAVVFYWTGSSHQGRFLGLECQPEEVQYLHCLEHLARANLSCSSENPLQRWQALTWLSLTWL